MVAVLSVLMVMGVVMVLVIAIPMAINEQDKRRARSEGGVMPAPVGGGDTGGGCDGGGGDGGGCE